MKNFLIGLAVFCILSFVLLSWSYNVWEQEVQNNLTKKSSVIETPKGSIEYHQLGEGFPVLVLHGAPGGYDNGDLIGSVFRNYGFSTVSISRPGYLRTPLETGMTPEEQADSLAELLNNLKIEKVILAGFSAGAPAAIQFAIKYPKKVEKLILASAVTQKIDEHPEKLIDPALQQVFFSKALGDLASWILHQLVIKEPEIVLNTAFSSDSTMPETLRKKRVERVLNNPGQLKLFQNLVHTLIPIDIREKGLQNDIKQITSLSEFSFEKIEVPTLVIHARLDKIIPFADAEYTAKLLKNAKLVPVEESGHLLMFGPDKRWMEELKIFLSN